ncbi:MAG: type II secretion system GspH family protein [Defluviitaleaceae bacterium]|nr:type II secretion system GspH family protein [Defluviitaleaceae bacterium]
MHTKSASGFTMVELIIVISVLALLATVGAVSFGGHQRNARRSALVADAEMLAGALNQLHMSLRTSQLSDASPSGIDTLPNHLAILDLPADPDPDTDFGIFSDGAEGSIVIRIPPRTALEMATQVPVNFESIAHRNRAFQALGVAGTTPPPFRIQDRTQISRWDTRADDLPPPS